MPRRRLLSHDYGRHDRHDRNGNEHPRDDQLPRQQGPVRRPRRDEKVRRLPRWFELTCHSSRSDSGRGIFGQRASGSGGVRVRPAARRARAFSRRIAELLRLGKRRAASQAGLAASVVQETASCAALDDATSWVKPVRPYSLDSILTRTSRESRATTDFNFSGLPADRDEAQRARPRTPQRQHGGDHDY